MSNAMNQESEQQKAPMPQTVVENIDSYLVDGMSVYDVNSEKVGDVKMYSTAAGYLMVSTGAFEQEDLYIPFRLIRSIDPLDIFVSATKTTLEAQYTQPPQTHTVVETRLVSGPQGSMTSRTREVQVLQSGYDNALIELNAVDVGSVADRLAVGMVVYDATRKRLGDITQYDTTRSLMVVEKGLLKPRAVFVPFSAIKTIDLGTSCVYLSLAEDTLLKEHAILPTNR
jgi:ribosomal 30S subunit maturation factor RimM